MSPSLEHEALDKIHELLDAPGNRRGLTAREIADRSGLAIGIITEVLRRSECCIRLRPGTRLWWTDWKEVDPEFRPARFRCLKRTGRPPGTKVINGRLVYPGDPEIRPANPRQKPPDRSDPPPEPGNLRRNGGAVAVGLPDSFFDGLRRELVACVERLVTECRERYGSKPCPNGLTSLPS